MHVEITRSFGLFRAGTTVELPDADAHLVIDRGYGRERRIDKPAGNASRDEWAAYAAKVNVPITDDMGRDDIIAATEAS